MKEMIASACYRILAAVVGGALAFGAGADVPLPQGYTRLEWIQSDGSQYIDTLYTHQPNSRVVASFAVSAPQKSSWAAVFGSRDSDCNNAFLFSVCSGKNTPLKPFYARNLNADGARGVVDLPDGVRVNLECDGLTAHWEAAADPAIADTIALNGSTSAGSRTMTLFGCRHETTPNDKVFYIAMKLFAFDIYEGDVAKRKFVPCCSLEGKVGLWDLVEGRFYGDAANSAKRFRCSDDQDLLLNYLGSSGKQCINTGYPHVTDTRVTANFTILHPQPSGWTALFGGREGSPYNNTFALFLTPKGPNRPLVDLVPVEGAPFTPLYDFAKNPDLKGLSVYCNRGQKGVKLERRIVDGPGGSRALEVVVPKDPDPVSHRFTIKFPLAPTQEFATVRYDFSCDHPEAISRADMYVHGPGWDSAIGFATFSAPGWNHLSLPRTMMSGKESGGATLGKYRDLNISFFMTPGETTTLRFTAPEVSSSKEACRIDRRAKVE